MNWWVYLGYGSICFIGILLFILVYIGIFICIDNYYEDKGNKSKIITLCGSTRFKEYFLEVQRRLSLDGYIVLMPGVFSHAGDHTTKEQEKMLVRIHRQKIDMSDSIFVINVDGYIGESTLSEINYAKEKGKTILYYEDKKENKDDKS